ncbi:MAG: hypothetical protein F9K32_06385 [Desulfobulbaceae bacterium]|nr:MAG: hypothetical protein F9K32_06385 [Desulfobulbaceae bacterium]
MNNIKKFPKIPKKDISDLYPLVQSDIVPKVYESQIVSYKAEEINEYNIGIWHRFLAKYYGQPTEINAFLCKAKDHKWILDENSEFQSVCEAAFRYSDESRSKIIFLNVSSENEKNYDNGLLTIAPTFLEWRYFFELPSKNIITIGSKNIHTEIYISLVNPDKSNKGEIKKETKEFISILLEDIKKHSDNLFNPKKRFREKEVFAYTLCNVYLSNYLSAEHIIKISDREEENLAKNVFEFSDKTLFMDKNAAAQTGSTMLTCGLFYSSAISYLFMALEGFINIIFHRFVKKDVNDLDMERGLNIEQKIRLMPYLCDRFNYDFNEVASETYKNFIQLKNYRNKLFHSKVDDSLFSLMDIYGLFHYNYGMDEYKNDFLPYYKSRLTKSNVIQVKEIVDKMIDNIINAMDQTAQKYVKEHILNSFVIPFMNSSVGQDPLLQPKNEEDSIPIRA